MTRRSRLHAQGIHHYENWVFLSSAITLHRWSWHDHWSLYNAPNTNVSLKYPATCIPSHPALLATYIHPSTLYIPSRWPLHDSARSSHHTVPLVYCVNHLFMSQRSKVYALAVHRHGIWFSLLALSPYNRAHWFYCSVCQLLLISPLFLELWALNLSPFVHRTTDNFDPGI
jgi:hypothetical protein